MFKQAVVDSGEFNERPKVGSHTFVIPRSNGEPTYDDRIDENHGSL